MQGRIGGSLFLLHQVRIGRFDRPHDVIPTSLFRDNLDSVACR